MAKSCCIHVCLHFGWQHTQVDGMWDYKMYPKKKILDYTQVSKLHGNGTNITELKGPYHILHISETREGGTIPAPKT